MANDALLLGDAAPELLQEAVAENHRVYFALHTEAAGGQVLHEGGVTWTTPGHGGDLVIPFPRLDVEGAGSQIDRLVAYYRSHPVDGLVGWWSLDPPQPADLEVRLLARGFQPGWRPRWMWRDLERPLAARPSAPGVRIELLTAEHHHTVTDLPYYDSAAAAIDARLAQQRPRRVWTFGAWDEERLVGRAVLCLTTGSLGVAGLYAVGVVPAARGKRIGSALTTAACEFAHSHGYRHVLLNATGEGERVYRKLGFAHRGDGWTWWLDPARLADHAPTPQRVALAEAVGHGDSATLERLGRGLDPVELDRPLPNGMTLLQLAAHSGQKAVAAWLVDVGGATLDITPGWALGWRERVAETLRTQPELANRRIGEMHTTPLHDAVQMDDMRLARLLLAARPDLSLVDGRYHATALRWAEVLGRAELLRLLTEASARLSTGPD